MTIQEAIDVRHAVRAYSSQKIEEEKVEKLRSLMEEANSSAGLHIQLVLDEPEAFDSRMAHYGKFSGVSNYFALVGRKGPELDERLGYWGEKLVLKAQTLGLNTCWVGLTFKKITGAFIVGDDEKFVCVIAVGYGLTQGVGHKVKPIEKVSKNESGSAVPEWFRNGVGAALKAPTAMNQQKFLFILHDDGKVEAKAGIGFFTKVDLGIVKCHFEIGAGEVFRWWRPGFRK